MRNKIKAYACIAIGGAAIVGLAECSSSASSSSASTSSTGGSTSSSSPSGSSTAQAAATKAAAVIAALDPTKDTNLIEPKTTLPHATLGPGLATAKAAGIPVFELAGGTDVPQGKKTEAEVQAIGREAKFFEADVTLATVVG